MITAFIITVVLGLASFLCFRKADRLSSYMGVYVNFGFIFVILGICGGVATLAQGVKYVKKIEYLEPKVISYDLVSLKNALSISGEVSGGGNFLGSSINGRFGSTSVCVFVMRDKEGAITLQNIPVSKITFFETKDEYTKVLEHRKVFSYPHSFYKKKRNNIFWYEEDIYWKIYLPKESFNQYIKFN